MNNRAAIDKTKLKPINDVAFKTIFGTKKGAVLLETLLKDILKRNVEIIEYQNSELAKISVTERTKIIDLLVKAKEGLIHIELNSSPSKITIFRNFVYFSGVILLDHQVGEEYKLNKEYISINLTMGLGKKYNLIEEYKIQSSEQKERISNIKMYEVNINKAKKLYYTGDKSEDVRHFAALDMTVNEIEENKGDDKFMESLAERLGRLNPGGISFLTPEEDDRMILNTMKKVARENGLKAGRIEGLEQGRKEGRKEGQNDGIKLIIRNMLQNGMEIKDIVKLANVDIDIVEKVAQELKHNC